MKGQFLPGQITNTLILLGCPRKLGSMVSKMASNLLINGVYQVPKMDGFLNLIFGYLGVGFLLSRIHTAYIGEDSSILGTSLPCLVNGGGDLEPRPVTQSMFGSFFHFDN